MSDRDSQSAGDAEEHDVLNEALGGVDEALAGRLTHDQQDRLDKTKIQINMENERYLQAHPEIKDMIGVFVHQVLEYKPDDILRFAGDFFTRPDLYACVKKKSEEVRKN
mmetsp:Transcript_93894/g.238991  ORF Transcript_93894/g.238991 Transcript_93894/m.238991 type:complete len:109 (-) Transcript_93894:6-332(-)|eukprot:CAMPEP_0183429838 /NCGR_PEP_ID=MMETSP0370-20130417/49137_1 /TAXON_ID=268820 /ORGANISM="Peridinium aciculiferum, Strain PAER-2" /LENGTH=108 /DNA_ID=CAMNT_0025614985 /DNA_START=64 /DNA_END=390 /DNA_ORIENTATION=+